MLTNGLYPAPEGKIACIVTYLEMGRPPGLVSGARLLERWETPDVEEYRALFRRVGEEWLWVSRLLLSDDALAAILGDPKVEVYPLVENGEKLGFVELDFRAAGQCEVAFFGLVRQAIGAGNGRRLMNAALQRAWSQPIERLWLHTCSFDHPGAVAFYRRSGFQPYALAVEIADDPHVKPPGG